MNNNLQQILEAQDLVSSILEAQNNVLNFKTSQEHVKKGKLKFRDKDIKAELLKDVHNNIPDIERDKICKKARKKAHSRNANLHRDISNDIRKIAEI